MLISEFWCLSLVRFFYLVLLYSLTLVSFKVFLRIQTVVFYIQKSEMKLLLVKIWSSCYHSLRICECAAQFLSCRSSADILLQVFCRSITTLSCLFSSTPSST